MPCWFFWGRTRRKVDIWIAAAYLKAGKSEQLIQPLEKKPWNTKGAFVAAAPEAE